jgi:hypothetical protein
MVYVGAFAPRTPFFGISSLGLNSLTGQILYKQSKFKLRSKLAQRMPDQSKIEALPSPD